MREIKGGAYVIILNKYKSTETRWRALHVNGDNVTYFDSFGVEFIPKIIKKFISSSNIETDICKIQVNNSIMCGYFCIGFINFILINFKSLLDYANLFSPDEYEKIIKTKKVFHE